MQIFFNEQLKNSRNNSPQTPTSNGVMKNDQITVRGLV